VEGDFGATRRTTGKVRPKWPDNALRGWQRVVLVVLDVFLAVSAVGGGLGL
jgi:hypothetical protein